MTKRLHHLLFPILTLGLGFLSGFSTTEQVRTWYVTLHKPFFTPPNWLFGPAWTVLYILMGIAMARAWQKMKDASSEEATNKARSALKLFALQFVFNLAWSPVFFGLEQIEFGLIIISTLAILIALTIKSFMAVDKAAGWILVPYLCWVCYATALNTGILILN